MLKPMQAEARHLINEANRLELELKTLDHALIKGGMSHSKQIEATAAKKQFKAMLDTVTKRRLALAEATRMLVAIPPDKRGHVRWRQRLVLDLGKHAAAAGDLTAQYVDARLLPSLTVGLVSSNKPRATYDSTERAIKLDPDKASLSDAMHEITHGIEHQNPIILRKTIGFLNQRAKGSNSEQMSVMMDGFDNNPEARGYRDKWWARGGDHYSGRYYTDKAGKIIATEIGMPPKFEPVFMRVLGALAVSFLGLGFGLRQRFYLRFGDQQCL
ncbi:hypothetical protein, partial [Prosthecobacter algae]|uniref:hypothetical protein n=1 Tax=Prosthecobacter algae TaxID=1144682 RepID=UPI0031F02398